MAEERAARGSGVQSNPPSLKHRAPCGVHHLHASSGVQSNPPSLKHHLRGGISRDPRGFGGSIEPPFIEAAVETDELQRSATFGKPLAIRATSHVFGMRSSALSRSDAFGGSIEPPFIEARSAPSMPTTLWEFGHLLGFAVWLLGGSGVQSNPPSLKRALIQAGRFGDSVRGFNRTPFIEAERQCHFL